ncbi:MAG: hypothetical protein K2X66_15100, partial [Cyanobacteria bacterium]|nr:hypothetical protein [Cyanobacteriota bacterium]
MDWINPFGKVSKFSLTRTVLGRTGVSGLFLGSLLWFQIGALGTSLVGGSMALTAYGMDQPLAAPA